MIMSAKAIEEFHAVKTMVAGIATVKRAIEVNLITSTAAEKVFSVKTQMKNGDMETAIINIKSDGKVRFHEWAY